MKTISFFTEKGGSGKTTFNMLMASYLSYFLGKRVCLVDFDSPAHHLHSARQRELLALDKSVREGRSASVDADSLYEIVALSGTDPSSVGQICAFIRKARSENAYDYMILDFPGSLRRNDASASIIGSGLLDMLCMPVRSDMMEISAMIRFHNCILGNGTSEGINPRQRTLAFFNFAGRSESGTYYAMLTQGLEDMGIAVSPFRVPNLVAMKKEGTRDSFRSTMRFPYSLIRTRAGEMISLFDSIIKSLV